MNFKKIINQLLSRPNSSASMNFNKIIDRLVRQTDSASIGLPKAPKFDPRISARVSEIMIEAEPLIGDARDGDYYKCSRERFAILLGLALKYLPAGAHVLDVGNAPGHLANILNVAGFNVDGINLNDLWNSTYPSPSFIERFHVRACNIETEQLPYEDNTFDALIFTEVLEHIAIRNPKEILLEFFRVLKPGGKVIFSTPNVCNISNVISLLRGGNIFWSSDIFYGGTDRHNREFTPDEVRKLFTEGPFEAVEFFGMNDHANWRTGSAHFIYRYQHAKGDVDHALLRNTIVAVFEVRAK